MLNVLMAFEHFPISTGRYVSAALHRLGHDVRTVGRAHGTGTGWGGRQCDPRHVHDPDHNDINHVFEDWTPDLVIKTDPRIDKAWRHPDYDVPHYAYNTCNPVTSMYHEANNHHFVAHYHAKVMPWQEGYTWLPNAYDPTIHTPSPIPWEEREHDVAFVGAMYACRKAVLRACETAGLSTIVACGPILEDYTAIYHNARMAVVTSTHPPCGFSMRHFENARHGCLLLAGDCADKELYDPPVDGFLWYESPEHAAELARYYLSQPRQAAAVIALSQAWAEPHTWDARAQTILATHAGGHDENPV